MFLGQHRWPSVTSCVNSQKGLTARLIMRANIHTEYAFRILIYLQLHSEAKCPIGDIARAFGVSLNHLNKVSQQLVRMGLVESSRGQGGGVKICSEALDRRIGDIMRELEPSEEVSKCMGGKNLPACPVASLCSLRCMFSEAQEAFWSSLNQYTVRDLVDGKQAELRRFLAADVLS